MKIRVIFAFLFFFIYNKNLLSQNIDFNTILETIQNLTKAIETASKEGANISNIALEYMDFINKSWPILMDHIGKIAELPNIIHIAIDTINSTLPYIETCLYVVGGCILLGSTIYAITTIVNFVKLKQSQRLFEY